MNDFLFRIEKTVGYDAVWYVQRGKEEFIFVEDLKNFKRKQRHGIPTQEVWDEARKYVLQNYPELLL